ncbi:MAG: formate dehydrogenase accessory protein FdhE [Nitrospirota bacterium]
MKRKKSNELATIIKRINTIEKKRPGYEEILGFLKSIMREQFKMKPQIKVKTVKIDKETAKQHMREGFPLVDKKELNLDLDSAATLFKKICTVLRKKDEKIAFAAKEISEAVRKKEIDLQELFRKLLDGDKGYIGSVGDKTGLNKWLLLFLAESSISPFLEAYADKVKGYVEQEQWWRGYCPVCGSEPLIGDFRGEEGQRFLTCSACSFQWRFYRLKCPFCGNEDSKKLRYFYVEKEGSGYRVEVCDECKKYIKTVNIGQLKEDFVPRAEDMGTLHLDILAQKEGYKRGNMNILEMEKSGTA